MAAAAVARRMHIRHLPDMSRRPRREDCIWNGKPYLRIRSRIGKRARIQPRRRAAEAPVEIRSRESPARFAAPSLAERRR